jgi:hypothetical protein
MNPFISRLLDPFQREYDENLDEEIDRVGKLDLHVAFNNQKCNQNDLESGYINKWWKN